MTRKKQFEEIGHCGGKVTFNVTTDETGNRKYQVGWRHSRPTPAVMFAVYALPQGIPVASINLGGIGQPWNRPPFPNCYPVLISSDAEGRFGHQCPNCRGYWRSDYAPAICPYCGINAERYQFLSEAQQRYVQQYCAELLGALDSEEDGEHIIDMDAVAEAVNKEGEKPKFYYAEEAQQNQYFCSACGGFNYIIGKVGYCSKCGTRNDIDIFKKDITDIRMKLNNSGSYESSLKEIVSLFDSFAKQYVKQLLDGVPLSDRRKKSLSKRKFHDLERSADLLKEIFDIDILKNLNALEKSFCYKMFHRRHVYEHNGGEADQKYIDDTGDAVRLKEALSETQKSVNDLANFILKIANSLHEGFHNIFPPLEGPIQHNKKINKTSS